MPLKVARANGHSCENELVCSWVEVQPNVASRKYAAAAQLAGDAFLQPIGFILDLYGGYIGILENRMEATTSYHSYKLNYVAVA